MNKNIAIVIGLLVVLLIGVGVFFFLKKPGNSVSPATTNQQAQVTGTGQVSTMTSLKNILSQGTSVTCTYSNSMGTGTIYVNNGKVRGDFEVTVNGQSQKSHMIVDGNTSYTWTDGQNTGYKMAFNPDQAQPTGSQEPTPSTESFDASQELNYNCNQWTVDNSKFSLPSNIDFMEFSVPTGMMQPSEASPAAGSNSSQCAYCENLTGDAKTQCLTALNCN